MMFKQWLAIEREDTMGRESSRNIIRVYHRLKDFLETQQIEYNYIDDPDQSHLIVQFQTEQELNMFLLMFSEYFIRYENSNA